MMRSGFVPALGTPVDTNGDLLLDSYKKQIEDQIQAGASAVLCMGSMGIQPYLKQETSYRAAKAAVDAVAGRIPVFIGAMDTSIIRAKERMSAMDNLDFAGFVFTTPYYYSVSRDQMINFYKGVASATKHKVLLYDLAVVTQSKITYDVVLQLIREVPNIAGIKSADMVMLRKMKLSPEVPEEFIMLYSGLDSFDVAYKWGITGCLDGMLSCTPYNTGKLFASMADNDWDTAAKCLDNITGLRDLFLTLDLWPAFTAAMNMLGYEGCFNPDYVSALKEGAFDKIKEMMIHIGEPVL